MNIPASKSKRPEKAIQKPAISNKKDDNKRLCTLREGTPRVFSPAVGGERASLILTYIEKWVNRTKLRYAC